VKWVSQPDHIKDMLAELVNDNKFTDVTLVCDDKKEIQAHKFLLSSCSPVFENIIKNNPQNLPVYLKGIKYEDVMPMLQFMYVGQATVAADRMLPFLKLASNFKVKDLIRHILKDTEKNQIKIINVDRKENSKRLTIHKGPSIDIPNVKKELTLGKKLSFHKGPTIDIANVKGKHESEKRLSIFKGVSIDIVAEEFHNEESGSKDGEVVEFAGGMEIEEMDNETIEKEHDEQSFGLSKNLLDIIDNIDVSSDEMSQNVDDLGDFFDNDISDICGKELSDSSALITFDTSSRKSKGQTTNDENPVGQKSFPFICQWCGISKWKWKTYSELIVHVKSAHKGYACCKCAFQTSDLLAFQQHVQTNHRQELKNNRYNIYRTDIQKKKENERNKIRYKRRRTFLATLKCESCDGLFRTESDLNLHIRKHHEKNTLSCDLCDNFEFYSEAAIKIHKMKRHQGNK